MRVLARKMEDWLQKLEPQLFASLPARPKAESPDITLTWKWVEQLVESTLMDVDDEMSTSGCLGWKTAWRVQQSLVASLVTGCYCPPFRLSVLISLIHPSCNNEDSCQDKDCAAHDRGDKCIGNHLELVDSGEAHLAEKAQDSWEHFDYKTITIKNAIIHHKTDRG